MLCGTSYRRSKPRATATRMACRRRPRSVSILLVLVLLWPPVAAALEYRPRMAEVTRVIDGDSFVLRFPGAEGDDRVEYRANLAGVDAPGRGEAECEAGLVIAVARRLLLDKEVWVEWDSHDKRTDDGRLLVYIHHREDREADLNALYIEQGWGWVPRAYPADRKEAYLALERDAREHRRGMWGGPCPPPVD